MDNNNENWLKKHLARIVCTAAAFLVALLLVTVGLFKTVFVLAVAVGGYFLGRVIDDKDTLRRFLDTYLGRS